MKVNLFELVLYHDYRTGEAKDLSGHQNHGRVENAIFSEGRKAGELALSFNGMNSRVIVPPSKSLADLGSLRVDALVWLDDLDRRHNIMEGFLAFAFIIEENGKVEAKVYNGKRWDGVTTPPHTMPIKEWIEVTFIYDGLDTGAIYLNNVLAATKYWELGHVHGVEWPFGISIGAWPDADSFIFNGKMEQIKLWRSKRDIRPWLKVRKKHG